jgi:hypothetical protein
MNTLKIPARIFWKLKRLLMGAVSGTRCSPRAFAFATT